MEKSKLGTRSNPIPNHENNLLICKSSKFYEYVCPHCGNKHIKMFVKTAKWPTYCVQCTKTYCNRINQISRTEESKNITKQKQHESWLNKTPEEKAIKGQHISDGKLKSDKYVDYSYNAKKAWEANHDEIYKKQKASRQANMSTIHENCKIAQLCRTKESVRSSIEKSNKTKLDKYGKLNFKFNYLYNSEPFDSMWELAFYIYHKDNNYNIIRNPTILQYNFNGNTYNYEVDFSVDGKLYEIKGDNLLRKMSIENTKDNAKYRCMLDNNVNIITYKDIKKYLNYCNSKYYYGYLKKFRRQ